MSVPDPLIKQHRLFFIDSIRGLSIVVMVEAHIMNSCLDPAFKHGTLFEYVDLLHGFVSVAFLFCAGAGFTLAARERIGEYRRGGPVLWHYLRRLLFILGIAYWLHLPKHRVDWFVTMSYDDWMRFVQFDILHVIGTCTLAALGLAMLAGKPARVLPVFAALSVVILALTPAVWAWQPESALPLPVAMALMDQPLSKFPLFPWAGYFFAGAALTGWFMASTHRRRFAAILTAAGLVLSAAMYALRETASIVPGVHDWWLTSPEHALYRLGGVAAVFGGMYLIEPFLTGGWLERLLRRSGQESLGFYVFHLMIVYGSVINPGLSLILADSLAPLPFIGVAVVVIAIVYTAVLLWQRFRHRSPAAVRYTVYGGGLAFLVMFLLWPLFDASI